MVKIVFSDIDGTFLTDDKRVTARTEQAVKQLLAKGIPFVLVSARMPEAIYPITDAMGIRIPLISYSGALVLTESGDELYSLKMEQDETASFLAAAAQDFPQAAVNYYTGHHWYVEDASDPRVVNEMKITGAVAEERHFSDCLAEGICPHKILMMMEPADCERAERELKAAFPRLNVVRSSATLLEVMDASVTKASGIEHMLQHFRLTPQESLSFGDNYNDLEMLRYTGTSVAMGNAPQTVKEAAGEVTRSNEEDGIYDYLVRSQLIEKAGAVTSAAGN